jgi:hypothetical protein
VFTMTVGERQRDASTLISNNSSVDLAGSAA